MLLRPQKALTVALLMAGLLVACSEPPKPTSGSVRQVLEGRRAIRQPLSGLPKSGQCSIIPGFIPKSDCREGIEILGNPGIQPLYTAFRSRLAETPTSDELHGAALLSLAMGPQDADEIRRAIVELEKALSSENSSIYRAELLTDIASAYLLLAEVLQSTVEVGAALEATLEALELDPTNASAQLNQRFAGLLLGIDRAVDIEGDPALEAIASYINSRDLEASPAEKTSPDFVAPNPCLSARETRMALDAWVERPNAETWKPLAEELVCSVDSADRFFPDLLAAAANEPDQLAESWRHYQGLEAGARAFDPNELQRHLNALADSTSTKAVRIAGDYFAAWLPYQDGEYPEAERLLERHRTEAEAKGYLGLAIKAINFQSLIAQVRGEYGTALTKLEEAEELSRYLGIEALVSKLRSQRSQLEILGGREYDAWRSQTLAIRGLDTSSQGESLAGALGVLAELAELRGFDRMTLYLRHRAVLIAEALGPGAQISTLRARGEALARLGRVEAALNDLSRAIHLLNSSPQDLLARETLRADLSYLEGQAATTIAQRRAALESALSHYRAVEYDRRILGVQHALAGAQNDDGDPEAALATLEDAFDELAEQVADATTWSDATGLIAAARPMVELLVGLQLDHRQPEAVLATIGRYLGLRSKRDITTTSVGVDGPRLTTFVRRSEVLLLLENSNEITIVRQPVERQHLRFLRDQVLLRAVAKADGLEGALEELASHILVPIYGSLDLEEPSAIHSLTIVPDDILAGTPFHLLPTGQGSHRLIDRWEVSYQTDLHLPAVESAPTRVLAIGASGKGSRLSYLPLAEDEARQIAALYPKSSALTGAEASPAGVRALLTDDAATSPFDTLHISSHFEVNSRWPLESSLLLNKTLGSSSSKDRWLTLRELLAQAPGGLNLLYLSACESGAGIPSEAHGLHSLAQAYTSAGIQRTVLTLWPLDDQIGAAIALRFHQLYRSGSSAAGALRAAQLEHRDEDLRSWGALIVTR